MDCQIQSDLGGGTPRHINEDFETSKSSKGNLKRAADFDAEDERDYSTGIHLNELVIYDTNGKAPAVIPHMEKQTASLENLLGANSSGRNLSSIGVFTVQCALCFKWRIIPTKEKYEEIREHILEEPFTCEQAHEWRPDLSCEDPTDISQDGSRLWAIDKPNIARPPPGWERILRIRGEGGTKFADVYYAAPSGKRLRSMVEIQKYLHEHPEHVEEGVNLTQFSFLKPRPLQENYVRKRLPSLPNSCDESGLQLLRPLEPEEGMTDVHAYVLWPVMNN